LALQRENGDTGNLAVVEFPDGQFPEAPLHARWGWVRLGIRLLGGKISLIDERSRSELEKEVF
jgi:hypothetical protein